MKDTAEIRKALCEALESLGKSRYWLAKKTGLPHNTIYRALRDNVNLSQRTLRLILRALDLPDDVVMDDSAVPDDIRQDCTWCHTTVPLIDSLCPHCGHQAYAPTVDCSCCRCAHP